MSDSDYARRSFHYCEGVISASSGDDEPSASQLVGSYRGPALSLCEGPSGGSDGGELRADATSKYREGCWGCRGDNGVPAVYDVMGAAAPTTDWKRRSSDRRPVCVSPDARIQSEEKTTIKLKKALETMSRNVRKAGNEINSMLEGEVAYRMREDKIDL